ncbi:MAG: hypothetical protein ACRC62_23085 [Microcoleus sp.]
MNYDRCQLNKDEIINCLLSIDRPLTVNYEGGYADSAPTCQPSNLNSQLSIINCQLSTLNSHRCLFFT